MEWVKLDEIISIKKGKKLLEIDAPTENSIRYIQIEDLRDDSNLKYTEDKKSVLANEDDILIAWDGANAGTIGFGVSGAIGSTIAKLSIKKSFRKKFTYEFLGYFLKSKNNYLVATSTGATIPHISRNSLINIKVPLIDLEKQEKLIDVFKNLEKLIQTRQDQIQALDDLVESAFYDSFGDYISNRDNTVDLKDITSHISSGSTPRGGSKVYLSEGIPIIRSQDVLMNKLDLSNVAYISEETHNSMKRSKLKNKDILLNITGASIGRTAVFNGDDDSANTNQHVASIRLNTKEFLPEFISYYFSTDYFQSVIQNICSGGTREALNYTQIGMFKIPNVYIEKQNQFAAFVEKIEKQKRILNDSLRELTNLFDSLMQDAFDGSMNS